ncbi:hypothetical protein PVAP13_1KG354100 [Panicum virgatum]|uniref:Uncharacterized protein n=1 Tax=Panicum virgatum TaxID=38727 RepID=A0A8T0XFT1_PANVG|nr:hypothetical protein PVAP13_1KG354100 [Panicum virgatum]
MEMVHHGVVGFFPAGGDGGSVKLLFLLLSVALVLACVAGCSADSSLSSIKVAGIVRFVFLLLCERAGHLFLCCFVFGAPDGFSVTDDGDGLRIYFRSLVSVPPAADFNSSSFLRELMADFRSSSTMRARDGSGRWLMRQIQSLESLSEKEGGSCLVPAVVFVGGSQELRGGARHGGLIAVITCCSRVFCVKCQGRTVLPF